MHNITEMCCMFYQTNGSKWNSQIEYIHHFESVTETKFIEKYFSVPARLSLSFSAFHIVVKR